MKKRATMQQIADELGVSKTLVSKALAHVPGVSPQTKERIMLTAMRLGYPINSSGTTVPSSKTGIVAVLLPRRELKEPEYWGKIVASIEKELDSSSFSMIVSGVDSAKGSDADLPGCIRDNLVDAVLALGNIPSLHIATIIAKGLPLVLVDPTVVTNKVDHLLADNYFGIHEATIYLLEKGHRKIGFVGDVEYSYSFSERYRGFCSAIETYERNHGVALETIRMIDGMGSNVIPFSEPQFIRTLQSDARPSGIVCGNDSIALRILKILEEIGIRCPEDVSIVGFDNLERCNYSNPPLTSVDASKMLIGIRAAQLLLTRMKDRQARAEYVTIATELIERQSVKQS